MLALGLSLLVGVWLRLAYLGQPLAYDEARTYQQYVLAFTPDRLYDLTDPNNHPLNTGLMALSGAVFASHDVWALRVPVLLAGVLLIAAAYRLGRALFTPETGLLAAVLVACAPPLLYFASNARGYSFIALFFVLLLAWAARPRRDTMAVALIVLGCLTSPAFLLPLGVWCAWFLLLNPRAPVRLARILAVAGGLTLLLYLPALASVAGWARGATTSTVLGALPAWVQNTLRHWAHGQPPVVPVGIVVGLMAGLALWPRRTACAALALLVGVVGVMLIAQPATGRGYARTLLFALPLVLTVAAAGLTALLTRLGGLRAVPALAVGVAAVGCWSVQASGLLYRWDETGALRDAAAITTLLAESLRLDDAIMCDGLCDAILHYHFTRQGVDARPLTANASAAVLAGRRVYVVMPLVNTLDGPRERRANQLVFDLLTPAAREQAGGLVLLVTFPQARVYRLDARPAG